LTFEENAELVSEYALLQVATAYLFSGFAYENEKLKIDQLPPPDCVVLFELVFNEKPHELL